MKNIKTKSLDINDDSCNLYLHKISNRLISISAEEAHRIINLTSYYKGIENIPDKEKVEGVLFSYNNIENTYIQSNEIMNVKINELEISYIQISNNR